MDYVEHDLKSLMETMKHKKQVFIPGTDETETTYKVETKLNLKITLLLLLTVVTSYRWLVLFKIVLRIDRSLNQTNET